MISRPGADTSSGVIYMDLTKVPIGFSMALAQNGAAMTAFAGMEPEAKRLVLGPFQGKTACILIPVGRGVCGTAVAEDATQLVPDVHQFPGHIACDCASNSEIVVPIHVSGEIWGVLDIDSPHFDRFSQEDKAGLEQFVKTLEKVL